MMKKLNFAIVLLLLCVNCVLAHPDKETEDEYYKQKALEKLAYDRLFSAYARIGDIEKIGKPLAPKPSASPTITTPQEEETIESFGIHETQLSLDKQKTTPPQEDSWYECWTETSQPNTSEYNSLSERFSKKKMETRQWEQYREQSERQQKWLSQKKRIISSKEWLGMSPEKQAEYKAVPISPLIDNE